jgi:hypothetical protein
VIGHGRCYSAESLVIKIQKHIFGRFSDYKIFLSLLCAYKIHLLIISDLVHSIIFRSPISVVFFALNIHVTSVYCFYVFVYTCHIYGFYVYNSHVSSQSANYAMIGE